MKKIGFHSMQHHNTPPIRRPMFFYGGPAPKVWYKNLGSRNFFTEYLNPSVNEYVDYIYSEPSPNPYSDSPGGGPPGGSGSYNPDDYVTASMSYSGDIWISGLDFKFRKKFTPGMEAVYYYGGEVDLSSVEDEYILSGEPYTDLRDATGNEVLFPGNGSWTRLDTSAPAIDGWYSDYVQQDDLEVLEIPSHRVLADILNSRYIQTETPYTNNFFVNDYELFEDNFSNEYTGLPVSNNPGMYGGGWYMDSKDTIIKFFTLPLCYTYEESQEEDKTEFFKLKFTVFFAENHNARSRLSKIQYAPRNACTVAGDCTPGTMQPPFVSYPGDIILSAPALPSLVYPKISAGPPVCESNFGTFEVNLIDDVENVTSSDYLSPTAMGYRNFTTSSLRPMWCYELAAYAEKRDSVQRFQTYEVDFTFDESAYHKITLKEEEEGEEDEVVATKIIELKITKDSNSDAGAMKLLMYITFIPPIIKP